MKKQLAATVLTSLVAFTALAGAIDRAPITVKDVTFKRASSGWITADVEFQAGDFVTTPGARKKDYLDRVKLTLTAAYEDGDLANSRKATAEQKQNPYEFYQRAVELAAVKRAKIITLRFFIPPAVVESKGFADKPIAWMLDWEVEGVRMPVDVKRFPDNFSKNLQDKTKLDSFNKFLMEGVKANEGIMLAQYHRPFTLAPKNDERAFAFIRKDP